MAPPCRWSWPVTLLDLQVTVILPYIALTLLAVTTFYSVFVSHDQLDSITPEWSWFSPVGLSFNDFMQGVLLCLFIYWGWDTVLAINEEAKDPAKTPGRAALLATVILLAGYLIVTTSRRQQLPTQALVTPE